LRARPRGHEIKRPRHLPQGRGKGAHSDAALTDGDGSALCALAAQARKANAGSDTACCYVLARAFVEKARRPVSPPRGGLRPCPERPSKDCERCGVVPRFLERSQVRAEQSDVLERRLLVLFEPEADPATGEAAVAVRLCPGDQSRELERLRRSSRARSLARLPRRGRGCRALERA
jgi:hypothetical protein